MKDAHKRTLLRWIHLVFSIPIVGYAYSPFEELPHCAPTVRYVAAPAIVLSGLLMWTGPFLRRRFSKPSA